MELNEADHIAPAWLAGHQQAQQKEAKPNFQGFIEPRMWPQDGGTRREPVMDMDSDPPRIVRYVGWKKCMRCGQLFWSEDVQRLRLCTPQPAATGKTTTASKATPPLPVVSGAVCPEVRRPGRPIANRRT